jgi:hypothetical protein|eukprot:g5049.t1
MRRRSTLGNAEDTRALLLRARTPPREPHDGVAAGSGALDNKAGEEGSAAKRVASVMRDVQDIGNVILRGRLCLRNLKLSKLPNGFGASGSDGLDYARLVHLDLSENSLRELPKYFGSNLVSLEFFDASNNCLKCLTNSIGRMNNLRSLYLQNNELRSIPYEIGQCTELRILRLENNIFSSLPSSIGNLTSLRCLYMYDLPALANIPEDIGKLKMLQELLMDGTPNVISLPESLGELHASGGGSLYVFSCGDLSRFENIPHSWYVSTEESYAPLTVLEGLFYTGKLRRKRRTALLFTGLSTAVLMWVRSIAEAQLSARFLPFNILNVNGQHALISRIGSAIHSFIMSAFFITSSIWNRKAMGRLMTGEVPFSTLFNSISLAYVAMETMDRTKRGALSTLFGLNSAGSIGAILYVLYSGQYEALLNYWHSGQLIVFFKSIERLMKQLSLQRHPLYIRNAMASKVAETFVKLVHAVAFYRSFSLFPSSKWIGSLALAGSSFSVFSALTNFRRYFPFLT